MVLFKGREGRGAVAGVLERELEDARRPNISKLSDPALALYCRERSRYVNVLRVYL